MFSDQNFFNYSLLSLYLITPPTIISLLFLTAPYGKHHRPGWGPTIPPPLAWFLMESPTIWLTFLIFPYGNNYHNFRAKILMSPFLLHYCHRTIIYPIRLFFSTHRRKPNTESPSVRKSAAGFPVSVALMAFGFNLLNGYLQSRWVSQYADLEGDEWFWWRFAGGLVVFLSGMYANLWSDNMLMGLKKEGGGYTIPKGGLFELVSCPNYFGEILEWLGWALMTWSWAGFGFFIYTCANLVPRAGANHKWYLDKFGEDYPKNRKAVIPFVF
ncbi:steroid 5-alpha-reductase DET2 [Olea europaea var. sylvestris]|uniref:steroid 5-alpha-reductase DET2 n=1 Tax=Olea europaea var. sylvestris TaxID=158386 RepID=UPI000C1D1243|nr:steroid 5-alpha-reductase DET2 [Olea europaea var. sylvestris]